jgi:hypothetical protein
MKPTKTPSARQIAANRQNAEKSTGPRTPQGQAVSRMNALKHGILSRQVLVRGRNLQESEKDLKALHQRFWEDLQPVGPVEELLVDQIVTAHWRMRRALTAESAEIALSVDTGQRKRSRGPDLALQWMQWTAFGDPIRAMQESSLGNAILRRCMTEVRTSVEAEGALTEEAVQKLVGHFDGKPNSLVRELEAFCQKLEADPELLDAPLRERQKTETLAFLDRKIAGFQARLDRCADEEESEEEARQAAAVLPSPETLDKILRYETKLERQMYRAMSHLERVQRMRRGEAIPAPLSVEVSDRG